VALGPTAGLLATACASINSRTATATQDGTMLLCQPRFRWPNGTPEEQQHMAAAKGTETNGRHAHAHYSAMYHRLGFASATLQHWTTDQCKSAMQPLKLPHAGEKCYHQQGVDIPAASFSHACLPPGPWRSTAQCCNQAFLCLTISSSHS